MERFIVTFPADYDDGPWVVGIESESKAELAQTLENYFHELKNVDMQIEAAINAYDESCGGEAFLQKIYEDKVPESDYNKWMDGKNEIYAKFEHPKLIINGVQIWSTWVYWRTTKEYEPATIHTVDEWFEMWKTG